MKKIFIIIKHYGFNLIPLLLVFISILITIMPYKASHLSLFMPLITYIVLYFLTIYQPQTVPYALTSILGLAKDLLESNFLGLSMLSFILFQALIKSQRKYILNNLFIVVWAEFMFCLAVILLLPLLLSHFNSNIYHYPLPIIFIQWLITIFIYVPIHWLLSKINSLRS